jgi:hypothetical protein
VNAEFGRRIAEASEHTTESVESVSRLAKALLRISQNSIIGWCFAPPSRNASTALPLIESGMQPSAIGRLFGSRLRKAKTLLLC